MDQHLVPVLYQFSELAMDLYRVVPDENRRRADSAMKRIQQGPMHHIDYQQRFGGAICPTCHLCVSSGSACGTLDEKRLVPCGREARREDAFQDGCGEGAVLALSTVEFAGGKGG
ncbi:hypothetical protein RvY_03939 [Ramazzottius varieornatus]|uniref:Uncharacterized protein n=1 Tax=Ramazzottius varieornatus TaxID=947166 RepID=A0A1D1UPT2_RAMVA|nr:hypothetical protein RvY_03939 [Ramazzottius varieornatus]